MDIKTDTIAAPAIAKAREIFEAVSRGTINVEQFAEWYAARSKLCFESGRRIEREEWEQSYQHEYKPLGTK